MLLAFSGAQPNFLKKNANGEVFVKDRASGQSFLFLQFISIFLLAGLAFPSLSRAEEDYFDLPPELLLNAQIINVSKRPESLADVPAAVSVLTSEDIQRAGVTNIPDALRLVPGVNVAQSDANTTAISIRGFNSIFANKLLVMIDGRTIYNPVFGGTFWEAHNLMLEDVDRIEVVRGPGGALWGANAVNGVINIITKHTRDTQGNMLSALYGTEEQGTLNIRHGGNYGENTTYRIYGKAHARDSFRDPDGGDANDSWTGSRFGFRMDQGDEFTLQGDAYRVMEQQFRTQSLFTPPFSIFRDQTLVYEGANILARWVDKHDDGSQLSLQSYVDWARRNEPYNFVDNRTILDIEAQYDFPIIGRHAIISGLGYRYLADNEEGTRQVTFEPEGRRDSLYSAFIQDKITLDPERWYLTIGTKFEHNNYSGFEVQPSARIQYHPDAAQTWWAAVSRAVRTPTPIEEDLTSTIGTAELLGTLYRAAFVPNDDYKSEELIAYELGYRRQITPTLSADIAIFLNDYDNLGTAFASATFIPVNNGIDPPYTLIPVQFRNDMKGKTYGLEIASDWLASSNFKLSSNYSFLFMNLEAADPTQEGGEDLYPAHQAGVRVSWTLSDNVTLNAGAAYVNRIAAGDVDQYVRVDLNLGWKIADGVQLNLVGQNLTTDSHREFGSVTDPNTSEVERSVFGKVTWEF